MSHSNPVQDRTVCIIGGGLSGLSAAFDLGRLGYDVTLLESSPFAGGLASSLLIDGRPIERFYHFICAGDDDLIELVGELGLHERLHWAQSKTSFYYQGRLYGFGMPLDLLLFHPIPLLQRVRFGLNVIRSRFIKAWRALDRVSARSWLIQQIGQQAYDAIWDPLLRVKFGDSHDRISAAWIWHRIHRVAASRRRLWEAEHLGYLERGSETVIEALVASIEQMPNVRVMTSARVAQIHTLNGQVSGIELADSGEIIACRFAISTTALPVLMKIAPDLPESYRAKYGQVDYLGVVCGLLKLKHRVTDSFWVNVNDPRIPFNGFIEYSNLNRHLGLGDKSILYVPYYLRTSDPRFTFSDEQLTQEFCDGLKLVNSAFDESWVEECHISRATHAQAICTVGFADLVPPHETPLDGLYITDSTQFYPEDRTISAAIRLGRRVARLIRARQLVSPEEMERPEAALV